MDKFRGEWASWLHMHSLGLEEDWKRTGRGVAPWRCGAWMDGWRVMARQGAIGLLGWGRGCTNAETSAVADLNRMRCGA